MATVTCSLAQSGVNPPSHHVGANVVAGTLVSVVSVTASAIALLCKVPANAIITNFWAYHNNVATTYTMTYGIRSGVTTSHSASALLAAIAKDTGTTAYSTLPLTLSRDETANESFKYVTASAQDGSDTGTTTIRFSVTYKMPPATG